MTHECHDEALYYNNYFQIRTIVLSKIVIIPNEDHEFLFFV